MYPNVRLLASPADTTAEPTEQYLNNFTWNKIRYRSDKPLGELVDTLQKVSLAPLLFSLLSRRDADGREPCRSS